MGANPAPALAVPMNHFLTALSLAALFVAPSLRAHSGPLDPTFGDGGMQHYGFQAVPGPNGSGDAARVGCPGPGGTFIVIGSASGGVRIVTTRLLPDGRLDPSFSADGKESFDFDGYSSYGGFAPAVCLPTGDAVIAHVVTVDDGEQNLRLVRVGRDSGLPVAGFGIGGVVDLDLDAHIADLARPEVAVGLNVLANGDLVITGYVATSTVAETGFAAVLDASGQVRVAKLVDCWLTSAAMDGPQGTLWVFGSTGYNACRLTLDSDTLAQHDRLIGPATPRQFPGAARLVRPGTVAMAVTTLAPKGGSGVGAAMQVFRDDAVTSIPLPIPADASLLASGSSYPGVQILPGGRVLYGATAVDIASGAYEGQYFALVHVGREPAGDGIEPAFGGGGVRMARFEPDTPECQGTAPRQSLYRMTQWLGRPAFVGRADATCTGGNAGEDYLVGRIETNYLFADGMD
ncbi:MAG: hypothetical protein EOP90_14760 [Lysobacteraceae bacterium]|nr:MAG: hypothetical protein EOP90_14760 [Xanthomonadaceae bacterium]